MGRGERDRKRVKEGVIKVIFKIKTLLPLMNTSWDTNFQEKVMPHPLPPCMKFYMQFPLAGKQFDIHGHCEPWLSGLQTHSAQNAPTSGTEKKRSNSHKTLPSVVPKKKKKSPTEPSTTTPPPNPLLFHFESTKKTSCCWLYWAIAISPLLAFLGEVSAVLPNHPIIAIFMHRPRDDVETTLK